jgi:hypothetical protein
MDWAKVDSVAGGLTLDEFRVEALMALGGEYTYNELVLPNPCAGNLILLEILNSPFVKGGDITDYHIDEAVFVISLGQDVVGAVFDQQIFSSELAERVNDFVSSIPAYDRGAMKVFLGTYFKYAFNGFDMLPKGDGLDKKMIFDTEWLATYVSICTKVTGYNADRVVWKMPVVFGGFCIARYLKENGEKGIERPQDWKAIFKELKRQMNGE